MVNFILLSIYFTKIRLHFVILCQYCSDETNWSFSFNIIINDYGLNSEVSSYVEFHNNHVVQFDMIIVPPNFYALLASLQKY